MSVSMLVLLSVAADAGTGFEWQVPEASAWVDVPGTLVVQGVPMKVRSTLSSWPAQALVQHIASRFEQAGLFVARRHPQLLREVQITGLDPGSLRTITVIFQPNPDRTTTLFLAEAAPASRAKPAVEGGLPAFPNAREKLTSDLEGARALTYLVTATSDEVTRFYAETFAAAGYKAVGANRFSDGRRELELMLAPVNGDLRVMVWERAAPR